MPDLKIATDLEIAGIGLWGPYFSDWGSFVVSLKTGDWPDDAMLQPDLIPPRERRRAPLSVKLAVETMSQACEMAHLDPGQAAVVFSSAMGDIEITDYMCKTLVAPPRLISPTKFHNSVHNATTGYWSIVSQTHAATNAVSAYQYTAPAALLETLIQAAEEPAPVLLVAQEMAAVGPLYAACPSTQPFSMALLITRKGHCAKPLASIGFEVQPSAVNWPLLPAALDEQLGSNFGAKLLPLAAALAAKDATYARSGGGICFPLNADLSLNIKLSDF